MLRLAYADSGSACKLAGVQIIPLPTLANQILARTFFRFRLASVCVFSRCLHSPLLEMGNQCRKTTLVAHFRGSTLQFCAEPQDLRKSTRGCRVVIGWRPRSESNSRSNVFQIPSRICLRLQPLESSLGRVPQAADGTCNKISQIGSCRSPRTV